MSNEYAIIAYAQSALQSMYDGLEAFNPKMEITSVDFGPDAFTFHITAHEKLDYPLAQSFMHLLDNNLLCNVAPIISILPCDKAFGMGIAVSLLREEKLSYCGTIHDIEDLMRVAITNIYRKDSNVVTVDSDIGAHFRAGDVYTPIEALTRIFACRPDVMNDILGSWGMQ